jgi:hypothetical protein
MTAGQRVPGPKGYIDDRQQRTPMLFDPFQSQPADERTRQLAAYLAFLERRDGLADRAARTLTTRDRFFEALDAQPLRSKLVVDAEAFREALHGPIGTADRRLLWLLVAAKANRGERYGVERMLARRRSPRRPQDAFVPLEEVYHTRILLDACALFGLEVALAPPPPVTRRLIALMEEIPDALRLPVVLCGEVIGAALFQLLLDEVVLFDEDPPVAERLRLLVRAILVDELGHVAYCRARIGRAGLWAARRMLPRVVAGILRDIPEIAALAGGRDVFLDRVAAFDVARDAHVRATAFVPGALDA